MKSRILTFFVILQVLLFTGVPAIYAQEDDTARLQQLQQEQADLENKISSAQSSEKTLSGQISSMDNQIQLTTVQINATQVKINLLKNDIGVLTQKITHVEDSLSLLQQTLLDRVRATYALGQPTEADLYLSDQGFEQALTSYHYLQILQENDLKLLSQMQSTKQNYGDQKTSLQDRQQQLQQAEDDLNKQTQQLAQQKQDKQNLLTATQSDEKRYQQLLAQSRAESQAIEAAIANSSHLANGTHVHKGDVIAMEGNSGAPSCSTGAHLMIEVYKNGVIQDPDNYLKNSGYVNDSGDPVNFTGSWDWPMSDPIISQGYGMTSFAREGFYGGGPHTGIDMFSRTALAIHAVADGTLYRSSTMCGSSRLNFVVLDHGDGIKTYYLHIQ